MSRLTSPAPVLTRRTLLAALSLLPLSALAQMPQPQPPRRNWDQDIGPTLADVPSPHYQFERLQFDSADGQRHYRVYLGIPRTPAPPQGYPVIYLLDGNAVMDTLKADDLAALAADDPPVLVGIGYEVNSRHDVMARAFDYTPPVRLADGSPDPSVRERGRPGGGADVFLDLIEQRIRPAVAQRVALDAQRQTLWGHSYGGLFTLHTLMTRPHLFQRYVAGDPSIGWHDGVLLHTAEAFHAAHAPDTTVRILVGGGGRSRGPAPAATGEAAAATAATTVATTVATTATTAAPSPATDAPATAPAAGAATTPATASAATPATTPPTLASAAPAGRESARALVTRLADEGMDITFEAFPEQSHGELFATSLRPALKLAAQ